MAQVRLFPLGFNEVVWPSDFWETTPRELYNLYSSFILGSGGNFFIWNDTTQTWEDQWSASWGGMSDNPISPGVTKIKFNVYTNSTTTRLGGWLVRYGEWDMPAKGESLRLIYGWNEGTWPSDWASVSASRIVILSPRSTDGYYGIGAVRKVFPDGSVIVYSERYASDDFTVNPGDHIFIDLTYIYDVPILMECNPEGDTVKEEVCWDGSVAETAYCSGTGMEYAWVPTGQTCGFLSPATLLFVGVGSILALLLFYGRK